VGDGERCGGGGARNDNEMRRIGAVVVGVRGAAGWQSIKLVDSFGDTAKHNCVVLLRFHAPTFTMHTHTHSHTHTLTHSHSHSHNTHTRTRHTLALPGRRQGKSRS
jgi:hypothetical protein